jgi:heat shock protein HtpX
LLRNLDEDETKAVLAHEVGHIKHNDMVVMVIVSVIPMIAYYVARLILFAPRGRTRGKDIRYIILVGVGAWAVYFITNLIVLYFSRVREYYADRFSGLNFKPLALANALTKITYGLSKSEVEVTSTARTFFIADIYTSHFEISHFSQEFSDLHISKDEVDKAKEWEKTNWYARISEVFRTHPLTWKRIRALHELESEMMKPK